MVNFNKKISIVIDKRLKDSGNKEFAKRRNRLIDKGVISYGVKVSEIRRIVKNYFKQFQETEENWLKVVRELMSTKVLDDQMAGVFILGSLIKDGEKLNISEIKKLITRHINNWAICDTISSEVIVELLKNSPKEIETLDTWAKSKNIWLRRAVLVTTVKLKNKTENWQKIASKILSFFSREKEPIIKKAVYWLEREID
ncbi:MAG: DNA alkylation repair protein [Candidatus Pacebacteria bacterium]|nr:DNA alkylation repair protein [Candidatus Paceibacterota bacterium]